MLRGDWLLNKNGQYVHTFQTKNMNEKKNTTDYKWLLIIEINSDEEINSDVLNERRCVNSDSIKTQMCRIEAELGQAKFYSGDENGVLWAKYWPWIFLLLLCLHKHQWTSAKVACAENWPPICWTKTGWWKFMRVVQDQAHSAAIRDICLGINRYICVTWLKIPFQWVPPHHRKFILGFWQKVRLLVHFYKATLFPSSSIEPSHEVVSSSPQVATGMERSAHLFPVWLPMS